MIRLSLISLVVTVFAAPAGADGLPLFASDEILDIVIEAPMKTIVGDRDERPVVDGIISYTNSSGETVSLDITLTTRGKSRLAYCSFPPLSLNLKKKQAKGTLFEGQNKLKIVTHCKKGSKHERYLQQEYGIYKGFNVLSDYSFRTRWLNVTYRDTERDNDENIFPGFFIESDNEVAARHNMEKYKPAQINPAQLEITQASRYSMYQFLIANTDWSMLKGPPEEGCCHNGKVIYTPGTTSDWIVLPYDFDQAGLINTSYSSPSPALNLRSVRQRLYRGRCMNLPELDNTIAAFNEHRAEIEAGLMSKVDHKGTVRSMSGYIEDFYEIINDPKKKQRMIADKCLGKGQTRG
jgi:hypothetical protein